MNRNTELHFGHVPKIHQQRSKFAMNHSVKTSWKNGEIIPLMVDADILPGDTVQCDMSEIVRMTTPIYPVMDNMILDLYWFFVPTRLVWEHWEEFWGQNDDPWIQNIEYEIPQIEAPSGGWTEGTLADYMGIPTKVSNLSVNALPFRAYAKIWSDWFRDENLKSAAHYYTDETTRTGTNSGDYVTNTELGALPCKAARLHDMMSSCLPSPQKGPAIALPLGTSAPVKNTSGETQKLYGEGQFQVTYWHNQEDIGFINLPTGGVYSNSARGQINVPHQIEHEGQIYSLWNDNSDWTLHTETSLPNNTGMYADLQNATAATVNALRTAFAIQKYYEAAGRFGTRYIEFLRGVFGTESSDARLQRSEYLGGQRIPINMDMVLQTSSTDNTSPQGNTAGMSCTISKNSMFTKSFEEHGILMCLAVTRVEHTYQQGLDKMWSRKKWTDFYNPFFANLGEMPVLNKEIYAQGTSKDDEVFGYQEAWAEYRYKQNKVTGYMRSNTDSGSLDAWHYADDYNALPTLGSTWIDEPNDNVARTLAVQKGHQLIGDFYFRMSYTRCMPVYSVPGLIDHV